MATADGKPQGAFCGVCGGAFMAARMVDVDGTPVCRSCVTLRAQAVELERLRSAIKPAAPIPAAEPVVLNVHWWSLGCAVVVGALSAADARRSDRIPAFVTVTLFCWAVAYPLMAWWQKRALRRGRAPNWLALAGWILLVFFGLCIALVATA